MGVGDVHGRFARVEQWLLALESARGRPIDLVLAVGDLEARGAEYAELASGRRRLRWPIYFVGGNNEDFPALFPMPAGGVLPGRLVYLGRAGLTELGGLRVAFLSGIHAPRHFESPLLEPTSKETEKQAGYYRRSDLEQLAGARGVELMLVHEWPRGLVRRGKGRRPLGAHRFPWIGSPVTRALVDRLRPRWLWCGHSHVPYAATLTYPEGQTRIACLDQASRPEGAVFWLEWEAGEALRAGWGLSGEVAWRAGEEWSEELTPVAPEQT